MTVENSGFSYSCEDAESKYIRSPFQGSSSAVTFYVILCEPLRIKVKHCPHRLLNQLLHQTATKTSKKMYSDKSGCNFCLF